MLLLAISTTLTGCLFSDSGSDFNPLYRSAVHEMDGSEEKEAAIPFFFSRGSADASGWGLRPFFAYRSDKDGSSSSCDFLPPLGRYKRNGERTMLRFWPLYWYTSATNPEGGEDMDWILFPLFFGGSSHNGEDYFAFFPVGGRIRNFVVFDTFDFILWPLYQSITRKATTECTAKTILLLFSWTTGGVRDDSFRILPFYMRDIREGKYKRYSVLWPFFGYQKNHLDTKHPSTLHGFWPLYSYEKSDNRYHLGLIGPFLFMGPLIQAGSETPDLWKNGDEYHPNLDEQDYYIYDLPWPLVHIEKNREFERIRVFPFYSYYSSFEKDGFQSKAYLIPFFWSRKEERDEWTKSDFFFVPFIHQSTREYTYDEGEDSYFQFWPLFHNASKKDGTGEFSLLSPLPLRTESLVSPVDEVLGPFWSLYRCNNTASGATRHTALFHLFSMYSDEMETRISFPVLYNGHVRRDKGWKHTLLYGLFSVGGDSEGLNDLRLLFIPFMSADR